MIRKSLSYCEDMILRKRLRLVDAADIRKGCIAPKGFDARVGDSAEESLNRRAGWGFDSAWSIHESGYAGPLCWQLNTPRKPQEAHA